ncbi:MAG: hypothetical protein LBP55_05975 [Candidatus Adiutrix sp.]|jgi:hypothetical protein|nr:hypothetical protein [Candidatus Adiutrix sp.]
MIPTVRKGLLTLLALTSLLTAGCAGLFTGDDSPPLSMFIDIPLPPELAIDEKNSQVFEHEIGRVGLLKASGRLGKAETLAFYRDKMAENGWAAESEFDNGEKHLLIFSKKPRSAAVTVQEGWVITDLEINVSAKQP